MMIKSLNKALQSLDFKERYLRGKSHSSHLGDKETETTEHLREITCISHLRVKWKEFGLDKVWTN